MWTDALLDKRMLPIADDPDGNVTYMSLNEENYGTFYFANHEYEDSDAVYLFRNKVFPCFTEFMRQLYFKEE